MPTGAALVIHLRAAAKPAAPAFVAGWAAEAFWPARPVQCSGHFASVPYLCMNSTLDKPGLNCTRFMAIAHHLDPEDGDILDSPSRIARDGWLRVRANQVEF